jgi:hypothetical protein
LSQALGSQLNFLAAAVLRAHVGTGVTLCAKNLFGATSINPDWYKKAHDGFPPKGDGSASYSSAFTDFLGHKDLGIRCRSLGVHEHWNSGRDKKYSRNLGKAHWIELFQVS